MRKFLVANIAVAALCALFAFGATPVSAALIVNGSFEDDSQAAGTWAIYSNLTGWIGGQGGIELRNNVAGTAFDGVNFIELDTNFNSAATQGITTTLDQIYTLAFAYSPRTDVAATSNGIEVFWNGVSQGTFTGFTNLNTAWVLESLNVTGTGLDSLEFRAIGTSDSYGGSLDAISLTAAVPETSTWAMLLIGFAGVGFVAYRRTKKNAAALMAA